MIADDGATYLRATESFLLFARSLSENSLDKSHSADPWTPRMVIHHVADSETNSYTRLRRLVAEPGTLIQGYNQNAWAANPTLGYVNATIETPLALIEAVRSASYGLIVRLTEEDLQKAGVHSESGTYGVHDWINSYVAHPLEHIEQMRSILL